MLLYCYCHGSLRNRLMPGATTATLLGPGRAQNGQKGSPKGLSAVPTVKPYNKKLFQSCQTLADFLTGQSTFKKFFRSPDSQSTFLNPSVLLVLPTASRLKSHLPKILLRRGRIFCLVPCLWSQDPCSCNQALWRSRLGPSPFFAAALLTPYKPSLTIEKKLGKNSSAKEKEASSGKKSQAQKHPTALR